MSISCALPLVGHTHPHPSHITDRSSFYLTSHQQQPNSSRIHLQQRHQQCQHPQPLPPTPTSTATAATTAATTSATTSATATRASLRRGSNTRRRMPLWNASRRISRSRSRPASRASSMGLLIQQMICIDRVGLRMRCYFMVSRSRR
jgi:hypothetical protein